MPHCNLLERMAMLSRPLNINLILTMNFNLKARRQESIKANNKIRMTFKQVGDTANYTRSINTKDKGGNS